MCRCEEVLSEVEGPTRQSQISVELNDYMSNEIATTRFAGLAMTLGAKPHL